jgi:hypothetical protein
MKKIIVLFFLMVLYKFSWSQNYSAGIIGGLSSTDVSGMDPYDRDEDFYRVGVNAGVFVNRAFNDRTSLQLELLYATKGSLQPADSSDNYLYDRLKLYYIEVPLLIKYKMHLFVNKHALDKLEIEAGPSYARLVYSHHENNNGVIFNDPPFNKNDFLINIGLTYYFTENFSFDLRFANSILPVRPNPSNITYYNTYYINKGEYNTTFNYTFRYTFR